ncbi:hypothetical protein [Bifidobacterium olomucense]|uniref:hypothetical protein n=1 Tax=Bifidobacterium olomucense TaxID=2675324 RepID=UPI001F118192|nr:hypothetical protein [Bifidobacterium sp. DSM 109959]
MLFDGLPMVCADVARAGVGGVAFHDGAVEMLHQILDQRRLQIMRIAALAGAELDRHLALRPRAQRLIDTHQAGWADISGEVDVGGHRIIGVVIMRFHLIMR